MASNQDTLVTVFGGSGFLGRNVVRALCQARLPHPGRGPAAGAGRPSAAARPGRPDPCGAGQSALPGLGGGGDARFACRHQSGRHPLAKSGAQTFDAVQAKGAETVAKAAAAAGARMVHVSAIGADENATSHYARAKAAGEKAVLAALPSATIMRPSVVFGPEDRVHQPFRRLARLSPVLPLIGGGTTRMQPVYVGDVATAVADAVDGKAKAGATYELGGPEVLTMREIMELDPCDHRSQAHAAVAAVRPREAAIDVPAICAGAVEVDAGSGRAAAQRQCRVAMPRRPPASRWKGSASRRIRWKRSPRNISGASARRASSSARTRELSQRRPSSS